MEKAKARWSGGLPQREIEQRSLIQSASYCKDTIPPEHQESYIALIKIFARMGFEGLEKVQKFIEVFVPLDLGRKKKGS